MVVQEVAQHKAASTSGRLARRSSSASCPAHDGLTVLTSHTAIVIHGRGPRRGRLQGQGSHVHGHCLGRGRKQQRGKQRQRLRLPNRALGCSGCSSCGAKKKVD